MCLFLGCEKEGTDLTNVWYIRGKTQSYHHIVFPFPKNLYAYFFNTGEIIRK